MYRGILLFIGASALALVSTSNARDFQVGDLVKFRDTFDTHSGKVVATREGLMFQVEFIDHGRRDREWVSLQQLVLVKAVEQIPAMRSWSDMSGRSKVEAMYVKQSATHVSLMRKTGKAVSVPIAKLSESDRDYLAIMQDPATISKASPFYGGEEEIPAGPDPFNDAYSRGKVLALNATEWKYDPQANAAPTISTLSDIETGKVQSRDDVTGFAVDTSAAVGGFSLSGHEDGTTVVLFDLTTSEEVAHLDLDKKLPLNDVNPDGNHVVLGAAGWPDGDSSIRVYDLDSELKFRWAFPQQGRAGNRDAMRTAHFIGKKGLLVTGSEGDLALWNWQTKKCIYRVSMARVDAATLSPNKRTIAVHFSKVKHSRNEIPLIYLIETATGNVVGTLPIPGDLPEKLAFNPSGTKLAGISKRGDGYIWDLESRKVQTIPKTRQTSRGIPGVHWCNEGMVLLGGGLHDLKHDLLLATYDGDLGRDSRIKMIGENQALYLMAETFNGASLKSFVLPQPEVVELAKSITDENRISLGKGTKITLDLRLSLLSPADQKRVEERLKKKITDAGMTIAANAEYTLTMELEKQEPRDLVYIKRQSRRQRREDAKRETVTVTPHLHRIELRKGDLLLFSKEQGLRDYVSGVVVTDNKTGETKRIKHEEISLPLDANVQEIAKKASEAKPGFFVGVPIPMDYIVRDGVAIQPGAWRITSKGFLPSYSQSARYQ